MIEVKLEDFEKYRKKLVSYARSLFFNRGFIDKDGELQNFAEDAVQEAYLHFHTYDLKSFISSKHLENVLFSLVYKEYLEAVDLNRKGAQYIFLKKHSIDNKYKEEFKQLNIRSAVKPTQDEFDVYNSFKSVLTTDQIIILDKLIAGFSKVEISRDLNITLDKLNKTVTKLQKKYIQYGVVKQQAPLIEKQYVSKYERRKEIVADLLAIRKKCVIQMELSGVIIRQWSTIKEAATTLDLAESAISNCCKGKRLTHGGFKWKYKHESTNSKV